jgi:predicted Zn-ribbon and HTH transcriptional regulator
VKKFTQLVGEVKMLKTIKKYINFVKHPKTAFNAFFMWVLNSILIPWTILYFLFRIYANKTFSGFFNGFILLIYTFILFFSLILLFVLPFYYLKRNQEVNVNPQIKKQLEEEKQKKLMEQKEKIRQERAEENRKKQIIRRAIENNYSAVCLDCGHAWHKRSLSVYVCPKCKSNNVKTLE